MCDEYDIADFDIAIVYCQDINRYPAQKTRQGVGDSDNRCMALYKEAQWQRLGYTSDSYCSGECSDCQQPCFGFGDSMLEHESIQDRSLSGL